MVLVSTTLSLLISLVRVSYSIHLTRLLFVLTGLGATRITEINRIKQHQLYWRGESLYYLTISNKRASSQINNKKVVTHKLPAELSRYLLLYDLVGTKLFKGREQFIYPNHNDCTYSSSTNGDNEYVYSSFSKIFDLETKCSCLVMRHLYTCICNYLFPNNNNINTSIVSTVEKIAEMSGHTAETHEQHYSSSIDKEQFFNTYHHHIGSKNVLDSVHHTKTFRIIGEDELLKTVKVVHGISANFYSNFQKQLIYDGANNTTMHTFCGMKCGSGKSMGWIIPTLCRVINGSHTKMTMVVLPYCFLVQHHYHSSLTIVNNTRNHKIDYLRGCDIDEHLLPNCLRDKSMLPSIIFLSLEAIVCIVKYHTHFIQELVDNSLIHKIFIDECHTILSELSFREKYIYMNRLGAMGIPITAMSGSYPKFLISDYTKYLFGFEPKIDNRIIVDEDIFGNKHLKITVRKSSSYIKNTCNYVQSFLSDHDDDNVHIITSTIDEGKVSNYFHFLHYE